MANYENSNVFGAGLTVPAKVRKSATDASSVNRDFGRVAAGGSAGIDAPMSVPNIGKTGKGPSGVVQGIYTQPNVGGVKF